MMKVRFEDRFGNLVTYEPGNMLPLTREREFKFIEFVKEVALRAGAQQVAVAWEGRTWFLDTDRPIPTALDSNGENYVVVYYDDDWAEVVDVSECLRYIYRWEVFSLADVVGNFEGASVDGLFTLEEAQRRAWAYIRETW